MKTSRPHSCFRAVVAAFLAAAWAFSAAPARAIIVYESPGRLTTLPVLSGSVKPGWQYIGNSSGLGGVPIGPRAWVTATHTTGTGSTGFWYDNAGTTGYIQFFGTRAAVNGDLAVMVLNDGQPSFQQWAPLWSGTNNLSVGQEVYMYGYGTLRGTEIPGDGWNWGAFNFALSYGTNQLTSLATVVGNTQFRMQFNEPTVLNGLPGTEGIFSTGDSGSGLFSFNSATSRWELLGINSTVEQVSSTPNGALLNAALYDARGYYSGSTQITGSTNVPLSSYSIALPYYESFLSPYVTLVPEPSTWALVAVAVGAVAVSRRRVHATHHGGRRDRSRGPGRGA